ncbi:MAG: hypothetical protein HUU35_13495, partial [Armatimonadetes bacterium]|nr:hypothetical protein [Armatimonadota bacterium]
MKQTMRAVTRRATLGIAMVVLAATLGCGGNGFGTSSLAQPSIRSRAALDGFVFVPSRTRQDAEGDTSIPHALIEVYVLPRAEGDRPIAETQADSRGFYRVEGLAIEVPLLIIATDPFDPRRVLRGVISFREDETEEAKERNLTPTSTLAAQVVERQIEQQGSDAAVPISDAQVQALETVAEEKLAELAVEQPDVDITLLID